MRKNTLSVLTEAAMMTALAVVFSYLSLFRLPQGGSIELSMLPIAIFAWRRGPKWGAAVGLLCGALQYLLGNGFAIDWTTILCDYLLAFCVFGLGAGLFGGNRRGFVCGVLTGAGFRFAVHLAIGALIWAKWMPEKFFGMTMTSPWFYSFLYNGSYMAVDTALVLAVGVLLIRPFLARAKTE